MDCIQQNDPALTEPKVTAHFIPPAVQVGDALVETVRQSYVTQFVDYPDQPCFLFSSGRLVPFNQMSVLAIQAAKVGEPVIGFTKDDGVLVGGGLFRKPKLTPAIAWKWLLSLNHLAPLRAFTASFELTCSRKAALHFLRYAFIGTNMKSQKYLDQGQFAYIMPSTMTKVDQDQLNYYMRCMIQIQEMHETLREFGWDPEDARLVIPNGAVQKMMWGSTLEGVVKMLDIGAEQYVGEVNELCCHMLAVLQNWSMDFFGVYDWKDTEHGESYTTRSPRSKNVFVNFSPGDAVKNDVGALPANLIEEVYIRPEMWVACRDLHANNIPVDHLDTLVK